MPSAGSRVNSLWRGCGVKKLGSGCKLPVVVDPLRRNREREDSLKPTERTESWFVQTLARFGDGFASARTVGCGRAPAVRCRSVAGTRWPHTRVPRVAARTRCGGSAEGPRTWQGPRNQTRLVSSGWGERVVGFHLAGLAIRCRPARRREQRTVDGRVPRRFPLRLRIAS